MLARSALVLAVLLVLGGLLVYSQLRPPPNYVSGFIEADEIRIGSRVGGRVEAVRVEEGQRVTAGQTLIELEPYDLLQRENEAIQTLAARQAEYRRLATGFRPEEIAQTKARFDQFDANLDLLRAGAREEEIAAARSRLQVANAELTLATRVFERRNGLLSQGAITREEFDAASEELQAAEGQVAVRQEELTLLERGTREEAIREAEAKVEEARQAWQLATEGPRKEEVEAAKAARDAAAAALEAIREQKKELVITSPVDGVVEALDLRRGDLAPAGAPVMSVMDNSKLWVRAYVPQNRIGLSVGQLLPVTVDSLPGQQLIGEIIFIATQAEFTPNNVQTPEERSKQVYRIKVQLPTDIVGFRPGMTANVLLEPVSDRSVGGSR